MMLRERNPDRHPFASSDPSRVSVQLLEKDGQVCWRFVKSEHCPARVSRQPIAVMETEAAPDCWVSFGISAWSTCA